MIERRTSLLLGFSQLVSWGVTYYVIGALALKLGFNDAIER